ncbi:MAG: hypothetical protein WA708_12155 [Acidobacteriaceae bacterium]
MTTQRSHICPQCGQPLIENERQSTPAPPPRDPAEAQQDVQEHDHRGIVMPLRTRMGGIITPQ